MISFRSQITKKILNYYFLNPGVRQYTNQLARSLEIDPKNLDRKLKKREAQFSLLNYFTSSHPAPQMATPWVLQ